MTSVEESTQMDSSHQQYVTGSDVHFSYEAAGEIEISNQGASSALGNKKKKKKKKSKLLPQLALQQDSDYPTSRIITGGPQNSVVVTPMDAPHSHKKKKKDSEALNDIWESSTEGQKALKDFWLTLPKDEQRKLVSISKESVLQAIRDNDKVNCDCSLCGRKRNAIEKELEVMYESYCQDYSDPDTAKDVSDAYLNDSQFVDSLFNPLWTGNKEEVMTIAEDLLSNNGSKFLDIMEKLAERRMAREDYQHRLEFDDLHAQGSRQFEGEEHELDDDEDDACSECGHHKFDNVDDEEEDDEEEDDQEQDDDHFCSHYPPDQYHHHHHHHHNHDHDHDHVHDHVHDHDHHHVHSQSTLPPTENLNNGDSQDIGNYNQMEGSDYGDDEYDEYDDEEDEEDEEDEDYDEEGSIDEGRRFQEARRMIQLFTTRMFHDRLLDRYRLKVSNDRSNKLLEELELEELRKKEKEEKKQKQKEKLKEKKRLQQQAKEEERLRKEQEKLELERKLQEEKDKRAEEQRKREEEKRKKKLEEQKRKIAELEKQKKEKLEKERLKKEEKQRKKDEERKKKEEELKLKQKEEELKSKLEEEEKLKLQRAQEEKARLEELERQQEALKNLQLEEQKRSSQSSASFKDLEAKQNYDSKLLLESLNNQKENTPSPQFFSHISHTSPPLLSSVQIPGFNQALQQPIQDMALLQQQQQQQQQLPKDQQDLNSIDPLLGFHSPLPPPGIMPMSDYRTSISGSNPGLVSQTANQQQSHIPVNHDAWAPNTNNLNGVMFETKAIPIAKNGFTPFLENGSRMGQGSLGNKSNTNFNSFSPLGAQNTSHGFASMSPFNDSNWKGGLWLSSEPALVESGANLNNGNGFNMRSGSIWNDTLVDTSSQLPSLLSPSKPSIIPSMSNNQRSNSNTGNWGNGVPNEELNPPTIALIQQAAVQAYQQMYSIGTNWVSRNTLYSQTQSILMNVVSITISMFLKSISSPSGSFWFEILYDDYGAVSMIRVNNKEAPKLNNTSFPMFNNDMTRLSQPSDPFFGQNQHSNGENFINSSSFNGGLTNGVNFQGLNNSSQVKGDPSVYNLWNPSTFTLL